MTSSFIRYEVEAGVAAIRLDKPADPRTASHPDLVTEYLLALEDADRDPTVRVVLSYTEASAEDPLPGDPTRQVQLPCNGARTLRTPVVVLLAGPVTGVSLALALAADVRLAATDASLRADAAGTEADHGITEALPRLIGESAAREVLLSARPVPASEALRLGLVHEVHPPGELRARGRHYATQLAQRPPDVLAAIKRRLAHAGACVQPDLPVGRP